MINLTYTSLIYITLISLYLNQSATENLKLARYLQKQKYLHKIEPDVYVLKKIHRDVDLNQFLRDIQQVDEIQKKSDLRAKKNSSESEPDVSMVKGNLFHINTSEIMDPEYNMLKFTTTRKTVRNKEELKCITACKDVFGSVCNTRSCNNMKSKLRNECTRSCKRKFRYN